MHEAFYDAQMAIICKVKESFINFRVSIITMTTSAIIDNAYQKPSFSSVESVFNQILLAMIK